MGMNMNHGWESRHLFYAIFTARMLFSFVGDPCMYKYKSFTHPLWGGVSIPTGISAN